MAAMTVNGTVDAAVPDYREYDFTNPAPAHQCDLVMKGGITSGVVYPPALLRLATKYRFRSIGGTSAGAIAAAAAAAAEYGRETGGFNRLADLQRWLSEGSNLRNLFQPSDDTRPLMETLLEVAGEKRDRPDGGPRGGRGLAARRRDLWFALPLRLRQTLRLHRALLLHDGVAVGAGAALGASLPLGFARWTGGSLRGGAAAVPLASAWLGGLLTGAGRLAWILVGRVPRQDHFFGMCIGHDERNAAVPGGDPGEPANLTDWLSARINELAGLPPHGDPLTFGDLSAKRVDGQDASINLMMVTTNLSHGEPYVFPREKKTFLFNAAEMGRFFPPNVVEQMCERGADPRLPEGYYFLPRGGDLPVIVATRMSLSFPVLLSAVPLYTITGAAWKRHHERQRAGEPYRFDPERDLQRNWFSDGGICSNFPIHFFDAWLPTKPTFGINLTSLPERDAADPVDGRRAVARSMGELRDADDEAGLLADLDDERRVFLPRANRPEEPEWAPVRGLLGLGGAVFRSAQNFRDTTQSRLPSYRERIVQVRFDNEREGGLNLAMSPETIGRIVRMGDEAAVKLLPPGEPGQEFNFSHHAWVRLQVLMSQLEDQIETMNTALEADTVTRLMREQLDCDDFPYPRRREWCDEAERRIDELRGLIDAWGQADRRYREGRPDWQGPHFFEPPSDAEPLPVLRVTPKL